MFDDAPTKLTLRTIVLLAMAVLAAMPLVWFSLDADAGAKMLSWQNSFNQTPVKSVVRTKTGAPGTDAPSSTSSPKSLLMRIRDTAI